MGQACAAPREKEPINHPEDYKANVVYLHTFPTVPHVYNISPFAIKVESFLRLSKIPYEMVYASKFGSKGQIPYVKLNGKEICDSNVIIPELKQHFEVDVDAQLTALQRALSHTAMRMLEEHTAQIGFYYRYGLHMEEFFAALDVPDRMFDAKNSFKGTAIANAWKRFQPSGTKKKIKMCGLGRHSDEELWSFSSDDLRAISDMLGEKQFMHGAEPTTIDCVVFGHLSQFLYIPIDFPQTKFLNQECANVVRFVNRFRDLYWPDWDDLCRGSVPPTGKAEKDDVSTSTVPAEATPQTAITGESS